ncbi:hypothetical protein Q0F98_10810 [Paenibacillus amylolyticus]|nr:hypothetical protein Q0F98_10810 [Paenibacillus amylolyticus]
MNQNRADEIVAFFNNGNNFSIFSLACLDEIFAPSGTSLLVASSCSFSPVVASVNCSACWLMHCLQNLVFAEASSSVAIAAVVALVGEHFHT